VQEVSDDVQVGIPVRVEVPDRGPRRVEAGATQGAVRDLDERAVPRVREEHRPRAGGQDEVEVTVPVEVPRAHADDPRGADLRKAGVRRDLGHREGAEGALVAVELHAPRVVGDDDVVPGVAVDVHEGHSTAHRVGIRLVQVGEGPRAVIDELLSQGGPRREPEREPGEPGKEHPRNDSS
jgi:hypothetical protein